MWANEETESHIWSCIHSANVRQPTMCQVPRLKTSGSQSWLEPSPGLGSQALMLLSYCSTPSAFPLCAEPGLPQQVGQGARPASWPRTVGQWKNTIISASVWTSISVICVGPSFLSLFLTIRSVALASGCLGLNLGSTTCWLSTLDMPFNFPRPRCPWICLIGHNNGSHFVGLL